MHKLKKTENLRDNVKYLIKSRGETQLSLCLASGLTRSTIYNILEGKVIQVQQSTIRKISNFFGVSCQEIETINFEEKELIDNSHSLQGNMNPSAVPIIRESLLMQHLDKRIGELSTRLPLTYFFGAASNLIAILVEREIPGAHEPGDLLIVKLGAGRHDPDQLAYDPQASQLLLVDKDQTDSDRIRVIGAVIEERLNDH